MANDDRPRFCPFCRECFEGEEVCPDHELKLVPFEDLPDARHAEAPVDDEPLELYEPRYGRGWVGLGALLALLGFVLPFVHLHGDTTLAVTAFEVANERGTLLWGVPAVALGLLAILALRRTPAELRGSRMAVVLLVPLGGAAIGLVAQRVLRSAATMGEEVQAELGLGVWVMAAGLLLALAGGFRLGVMPK